MKRTALLASVILSVLFAQCSANKKLAKKEEPVKDVAKEVPAEITYTAHVQNIIASNCLKCHTGPKAPKQVDLTNYENVKAHMAKGELLKRINDAEKPMPPNGLMSKGDRLMLMTWAKKSYKE